MFLNIVLDDAVEEKASGERQRLGMVVIRGNSVVMLEVCGRHVSWWETVLMYMVYRLSREWETTDDENEHVIRLRTILREHEKRKKPLVWYLRQGIIL